MQAQETTCANVLGQGCRAVARTERMRECGRS